MRRRARTIPLVRPVSSARSAINVTPLVDVVLVLLIIFMVVMPLAEKDLNLRIPETEQLQTTDVLPANQIVVAVDGAGRFTIDGEATADERYVEALKSRLAQRRTVEQVVFVSSDDEAPYARLVTALEGARGAGASALGMITEPPLPAPAGIPGVAGASAPPPSR